MNSDQSFFSLPDLAFDRVYLKQYCQDIYRSQYTHPIHLPQETFGMTWVPINNKEIERIRRVFPINLSRAYLCVFQPGTESGPHTDAEREATLILPLSEDLVFRFENESGQHQVTYNSPIITNAKKPHNAVNDSDTERINVLFHILTPYEEVLANYRKGNFFNCEPESHVNSYRGIYLSEKDPALALSLKKRFAFDSLDKTKMDPDYLTHFDIFVSDNFLALKEAHFTLPATNKRFFYIGALPESSKWESWCVAIETQRPTVKALDALAWLVDQPPGITRITVSSDPGRNEWL